MALPPQPYPLVVARPGLDPDLNHLGSRNRPLAMAIGACALQFAGAATARAGNFEFHAPTHLGNLAGALAFRTSAPGASGRLSFAAGANFLPHHLQPRYAAANRTPEIHRDLVLQICPRLRSLLPLILGKHAGEDIPETAPARARGSPACFVGVAGCCVVGEVEASKVGNAAAPARGAR